MSKAVLLHGGGLDSTAVFLHLVNQAVSFDCFWCDYGQVAANAERQHILDQCESYGVSFVESYVDVVKKLNEDNPCMIFTGDHTHTPVVEGRNMCLIIQAAFKGYDKIYVGIDKPASGKAWGDASKEFIQAMNDMLRMSFTQRKIEVVAPFIDTDKEEVFKQALLFDDRFFYISMTCWTPLSATRRCGECKHCKLEQEYKRKLGLGVSDE